MHNEMIAKVPLHGGFVGYASRQQRRELKEKKKRAIGHWRPISISVAAYREKEKLGSGYGRMLIAPRGGLGDMGVS